MKKYTIMKSFVIILCFILILPIGFISAQKYSIEAGFVSPKQNGTGLSDTYFNGIKLGANVSFDLKNNFSLLTGALYNVVYAYKVQKYGVSTDSVTYQTWGHYLDIPLRVQYALPLGKNLRLFGFVGPNLSIGIAQPQKVNSELSADFENLTGIHSMGYSENDLYKKALISRFNFQMGAGGGVQWKNIQLKGGYDFGINSINKIDSNNLMHQSGWYVSLVYQF